jgi:hypothetical protein
MASPTTNSTNDTLKSKVPGSIHQNDRFLEYVKYLIIFYLLVFISIDTIQRQQRI